MAKKKEVHKEDSKLGQLVEWVNSADNATTDSRKVSEKCRDYYDSKQWTAAEEKKLAAQKQAATVRNRIKPKMDGLMGMERANRTTVKCFGRTPQHQKAALAAQEACRFVLQDNFYNEKRSGVWDNLLMEGTGGVEVLVEPRGDEFDVKINHIPWDRIIYDPHSRRKDFSDSKYLGQVIWLDFDDAKSLYPQATDILEVMQAGSQTYDDKPMWVDGRKRCKIVELYYYEGGEVYYALFTRGGFIKAPKLSAFKNEIGETEWPYEFGTLFVTRNGERYGAVFQLLDIQDEINKRGSKALHLLSVRQVMIEKGAVEDVEKARKELAKPDGIVEVTPGMLFEVLKTGDMAAGQVNLLQEAKAEIDAVSYNAAAAGKEVRNMSGVALRTRESASQTELAPMFDVLKHIDIRVYRKVWNRIKQYWKGEKWIRVTDNEHDLNWVGLNKPVTKGEMMMKQHMAQMPEGAEQDPQMQQQMAQMQQQIAQDPSMREVVDTENDIASLDVDIIIDDAPDTLTTQIEDFQVLGEMVKSGFQMPPIAVIKASPLSNKDELIKMMQEQNQVPPEVQKQMDKMKEEVEKLSQENQQLKSGAQEAQMKVQAGMQESQAKLEARKQEAELELQLKAQIQAQELQLEREKVHAEIELERFKVQSEIELETMKLQMTQQQGMQKLEFDKQQGTQKLEFDKQIRSEDMASKTEQENKSSEDKILPKVLQTLETLVKDNQKHQSEQSESGKKQKTITLKLSDGKTATATIN